MPELPQHRAATELPRVENKLEVLIEMPPKPAQFYEAVTFKDLCYTLPGDGSELRVLDGVTGRAAPGDLVGVMGPSGAGKTSLINVLSGRVSSEFLSGSCSLHDGGYTKRQIGFVFQDDMLLSELTVRETILFSAMLRLPQELPQIEREALCDALIQELGLEAVKDNRIGDAAQRGVSGGERKRTAIAVELITKPAVLFLDEPTSGLDASTALSLVQTLKSLCNSGHTVVCTIHQPRANILWLFNQILLLESGRTAFTGPPQEAVAFFASVGHEIPAMTNPADYLMDTLKEHGSDICDAWAQRAPELTDDKADAAAAASPAAMSKSERWVTSFWWQLLVLFRRHNAQSRGNTFTPANSFVIALMGCVTILLWFQSDDLDDLKGLLFFILIQQGFNALNGILRIFPSERSFVIRERSVGAYHVGAYFLAKTSADLLNTVVMPALFATGVFFGAGFEFEWIRFTTYLLVFLMAIITAQSMGLLLSCAITDAATVQIVAPVLLLTLMLTGGFYVNPRNVPSWMIWLKYLSFQYWGYAGLMKNEFGGRTFDCSNARLGAYGHECPIRGEHILEENGLGDADVATSVCVMGGMAFGYRVIAYILLRWRT